ncbi:hypothetical protein LCGC14_1783180 [marine sediment metagenome]|uniref:Uncharacterized protein n=1 Tax=marine sediment metagenome TaxID=412755 RepID=A0A0F9J9N4_9ZZZZ
MKYQKEVKMTTIKISEEAEKRIRERSKRVEKAHNDFKRACG